MLGKLIKMHFFESMSTKENLHKHNLIEQFERLLEDIRKKNQKNGENMFIPGLNALYSLYNVELDSSQKFVSIMDESYLVA